MSIQMNPTNQNNPNPSLSPEDMDLLQKKQEILVCIDNLSVALASILIYPQTHERMIGNIYLS